MRHQLIIFLALNFANFGFGKRIELLRFKQAPNVPTGDFIPVYSAIEDYPDPYNDLSEKTADLVLLKPMKNAVVKHTELRNFDSLSSISKSETNDYEHEQLESTADSEGRNFQPIQYPTPELSNFQSLPALAAPELKNRQTLALPAVQIPELTNFHLPTIATSALKNLQPVANEETSSGRTFKHFLLLKSLLGAGGGGGYGGGHGGGGGGGGSGGYGVIYPIIVNTPVNVTNVNNNTLTNTPAAAAAAAAALEDAVRINYVGVPQVQSMPMQIPMQSLQMPTQMYHQPTPVYQQRQAVSNAHPTYAVAMLNIPGTSSLIPFSLPQYQSSVNRNNGDVERRHTLGFSNASKNQNPWSAFANNLRGLQFL